MSELPEETVEAAAYPVFVGACQAPWTSRTMDELCPVQPLSKRQAINLARSALTNATNPVFGPDRLVVAGPHEQEIIEKVIVFLMDRSDDGEYGEALQTAVNEITTRFLGAS